MNIDNRNPKIIYSTGNETSGTSLAGREKNSDYKSFSKELEVTQQELLTENQETLEKNTDEALIISANAAKIKNNAELNLINNLKMLNQKDIKIGFIEKITKTHSIDKCYKINLKNLKDSDIDFLKKLTQKNEISVHLPNFENQQNLTAISDNSKISYSSVDFSKTFSDLINHAYTTQKPVRIDFDADTAVIIKIDKQGRVSAEFIPGDEAVARAIKNALPELQAKFIDEKLPYNELKSRNYNDKQERKNKQKESDKDE